MEAQSEFIKVYNEFKKLSSREMKKALQFSIRKGLNVVKKATQTNLNKPQMNKGVRLGKVFEDREYNIQGSVRITKTKKHYKSFVLPWLESGTNPRYTKGKRSIGGKRSGKKAYRGRMSPLKFFSKAISATQSKVKSAMEEGIKKFLDKIKK